MIKIAIEAAIQGLPYGGLISTSIFGTLLERHNNRVDRNIEELFTFKKSILEEMKLSKERFYLLTQTKQEEFQANFWEWFEKAKEEHLEEKRKMFKNFLENLMLFRITDSYDERKYFLEAISGMTHNELYILSQLYTHAKEMKLKDLCVEGVDLFMTRASISRLESYGFVWDRGFGNATGDNVFIEGEEELSKHNIRLIPFGRKFYSYCLEEPVIS